MGYKSANRRVHVNNVMGRKYREDVVIYFNRIYLEGVRTASKNINQYRRSPESNSKYPKY
jgi:hypothetical protein